MLKYSVYIVCQYMAAYFSLHGFFQTQLKLLYCSAMLHLYWYSPRVCSTRWAALPIVHVYLQLLIVHILHVLKYIPLIFYLWYR